jgi:hypothetical protein
MAFEPLAAPLLRFGLNPFFVTFAPPHMGLQHLLQQSNEFCPCPHVVVPDNACKCREQAMAPQLLDTSGDMGFNPHTAFKH